MCDEQITRQPIRMAHQRPAHASSCFRHRPYELCVHRVDTRTNLGIAGVEGIQSCWRDAVLLDCMPDEAPELPQVIKRDTPTLHRHLAVQAGAIPYGRSSHNGLVFCTQRHNRIPAAPAGQHHGSDKDPAQTPKQGTNADGHEPLHAGGRGAPTPVAILIALLTRAACVLNKPTRAQANLLSTITGGAQAGLAQASSQAIVQAAAAQI
mmetsp:Transcript_33913/g.93808  ORF Transcript_33913/g.93808 Transcript_33913/m.93808 type:complete len:208 (-) Transcript_33913:232-855(-)